MARNNNNGEIGIMVDTTEDKRVLVAFNQNVDHLKFTPQQAVEFAEVILKKVIELEPKTTLILPSQMN